MRVNVTFVYVAVLVLSSAIGSSATVAVGVNNSSKASNATSIPPFVGLYFMHDQLAVRIFAVQCRVVASGAHSPDIPEAQTMPSARRSARELSCEKAGEAKWGAWPCCPARPVDGGRFVLLLIRSRAQR